MTVRLATPKDKMAVLSLMDELGEEINKKRGYSPHNAEASRVGGGMFDEVVRRKDTTIFVAEEDGKLVGLMTFYLLPNLRHGFYGGHIEDVVVSAPHRRKGIGTALFAAVKQYCVTHGVSVIKLDSALQLTEAHAFYERQGGVHTEIMYRFDLKS